MWLLFDHLIGEGDKEARSLYRVDVALRSGCAYTRRYCRHGGAKVAFIADLGLPQDSNEASKKTPRVFHGCYRLRVSSLAKRP